MNQTRRGSGGVKSDQGKIEGLQSLSACCMCSPTPSRRCGPLGAPPWPPKLPTLARGRRLSIQRVELLARTFVVRGRTLLALPAAALRAVYPEKEKQRRRKSGLFATCASCTVHISGGLRAYRRRFFVVFNRSSRVVRPIKKTARTAGVEEKGTFPSAQPHRERLD